MTISSKNEVSLMRCVIENLLARDCVLVADVQINQIDWDLFKSLAHYHGLFGFSYCLLKPYFHQMPAAVANLMTHSYYKTLARTTDFHEESVRIQRNLSDASIVVVPIKGAAFLFDLYADFPVRPMNDIDLLVKKEDLGRVEDVLVGLGYVKDLEGYKESYWLNDQYHLAFEKKLNNKRYIVEIHWGLDYPRNNRMILMELWGRLSQIDYNGFKVLQLSPEDAFLSLVLHNRRLGKTLSLKSVNDIILLLRRHRDHFDWPYIFHQCRRYQLNAAVYFALSQAQLMVDLQLDQYIWKSLRVTSLRKILIHLFIKKYMFNLMALQSKVQFLKEFFLLFDDFLAPVRYILMIPQEQFARYYDLDPYAEKTKRLYVFRVFFCIYKFFFKS